jgi:hypothetical protein
MALNTAISGNAVNMLSPGIFGYVIPAYMQNSGEQNDERYFK